MFLKLTNPEQQLFVGKIVPMERQCAHSPPVANRVKVYIGKYIYKKDFVQVCKKIGTAVSVVKKTL